MTRARRMVGSERQPSGVWLDAVQPPLHRGVLEVPHLARHVADQADPQVVRLGQPGRERQHDREQVTPQAHRAAEVPAHPHEHRGDVRGIPVRVPCPQSSSAAVPAGPRAPRRSSRRRRRTRAPRPSPPAGRAPRRRPGRRGAGMRRAPVASARSKVRTDPTLASFRCTVTRASPNDSTMLTVSSVLASSTTTSSSVGPSWSRIERTCSTDVLGPVVRGEAHADPDRRRGLSRRHTRARVRRRAAASTTPAAARPTWPSGR